MSNRPQGKPSLITLFPGARINLNVSIGGKSQPRTAPKPISRPSAPQPKRITAPPTAKATSAAKASVSKVSTAPKSKPSTPASRPASGAVRKSVK